MRGFVLSIVALLFLVFLFLIATSLHSHYLAMERVLLLSEPVTYADFSADQAVYGLNSILGPRISMDPGNASFGILISQDTPAKNVSSLLSRYQDLLEQDLAEASHASISLNLSGVSSSSYQMEIADSYLFSNSQEGKMEFRGISGESGAYSYSINITVPKERISLIPFGSGSPSGINTTIRYLDLNGSYSEETILNPSGTSEFLVQFTDNSTLRVFIGRDSGDDGALVIEAMNCSAQISLGAALPPLNESQRPSYTYEVWINHSSGPYSVERRIST
ncbi:MAG: hypothetical protein AB1295_06535 [Candidatus Micrarchaeota archaeon]